MWRIGNFIIRVGISSYEFGNSLKHRSLRYGFSSRRCFPWLPKDKENYHLLLLNWIEIIHLNFNFTCIPMTPKTLCAIIFHETCDNDERNFFFKYGVILLPTWTNERKIQHCCSSHINNSDKERKNNPLLYIIFDEETTASMKGWGSSSGIINAE